MRQRAFRLARRRRRRLPANGRPARRPPRTATDRDRAAHREILRPRLAQHVAAERIRKDGLAGAQEDAPTGQHQKKEPWSGPYGSQTPKQVERPIEIASVRSQPHQTFRIQGSLERRTHASETSPGITRRPFCQREDRKGITSPACSRTNKPPPGPPSPQRPQATDGIGLWRARPRRRGKTEMPSSDRRERRTQRDEGSCANRSRARPRRRRSGKNAGLKPLRTCAAQAHAERFSTGPHEAKDTDGFL